MNFLAALVTNMPVRRLIYPSGFLNLMSEILLSEIWKILCGENSD